MILIDDREGSQDLALHEPVRSLLSPCPGCGGSGLVHGASVSGHATDKAETVRHLVCRGTGRQLATLNSGDVCILGHGPGGSTISIGVELKSIADILSSFDTGRLQATQIPKMNEDYDVRWLLIYGAYRIRLADGALEYLHREKDARTGKLTGRRWWQVYARGKNRKPVMYAYLKAALMETTELGFSYDHVQDVEEAVAWLGILHAWWTKPHHQHKLMHRTDESRKLALSPAMANKDPRWMRRVEVAKRLLKSGIGYDKAMAAADTFGSVIEMVTATTERWMMVPGIGKTLAKAVVEAVS